MNSGRKLLQMNEYFNATGDSDNNLENMYYKYLNASNYINHLSTMLINANELNSKLVYDHKGICAIETLEDIELINRNQYMFLKLDLNCPSWFVKQLIKNNKNIDKFIGSLK